MYRFTVGRALVAQRTPGTRARLFAFAAAHGALLLCAHLRYPGLGRLVRSGNTYAWRAVD